jgi:hypothetical protein
MKTTRKRYTPEFKARVVLEAIRGDPGRADAGGTGGHRARRLSHTPRRHSAYAYSARSAEPRPPAKVSAVLFADRKVGSLGYTGRRRRTAAAEQVHAIEMIEPTPVRSPLADRMALQTANHRRRGPIRASFIRLI